MGEMEGKNCSDTMRAPSINYRKIKLRYLYISVCRVKFVSAATWIFFSFHFLKIPNFTVAHPIGSFYGIDRDFHFFFFPRSLYVKANFIFNSSMHFYN